MADSDDDLALGGIFTEPPRPPTPEATVSVYDRDSDLRFDDSWSEISIRLVGSHPLWGHYLWNAARAFASYLDHNQNLYTNGFVLELGAGGGLPGIVAAKNGAKHVLLTDYPDAELVTNLEHNVKVNLPGSLADRVSVQGYIWGHAVQPLLDALPPTVAGYNLIILSDLVFNHSQHDSLLKTCKLCLAPGACVLVFYTSHRPHLAHRDREFFTKAREQGWTCEEILLRQFAPMFPKDSGEESVRSTVHGWRLELE
ncbi:putative methyltransferase-domain-containing protein [Mycena rebaudengoi]|nr:putative methyltransferase-domain-containing protein [Mycena rebaudengoi]